MGDTIMLAAFPLMAVSFTRSPNLVSTVTLFGTLPWLVVALPAGLLMDRIERRGLMAFATVAGAALLGCLAFVLQLGGGSLWLLDSVAFALGSAQVVIVNVGSTVMPQVIAAEDLTRGNSLLYAVQHGVGELGGPPIAGSLVVVGLAMPAWAAASCYFLSAIVLLTWRSRFFGEQAYERAGGVVRDLFGGLFELLRRADLLALAMASALVNLGGQAVIAVLVLFVVRPGELGLSRFGYGLLLTAYAVGGLLGAAFAGLATRRLGERAVLTSSLLLLTIGWAIPFIWILPQAAGIGLVVVGIGSAWFGITVIAWRQRSVSPGILGRVTAAFRVMSAGAMPVGAVLGGVVARAFGVRSVFILGAATPLVALTLVMVRFRPMYLHEKEVIANEPEGPLEGSR
ncbi:MAG: MFS transporter [Acidobacteria bacterium]|nr:MFS transporter [Acidobacteriota bacterium]